ncbi:MAG: hypothetical protein ACR2PA_10905, partial [Hyphomicrobiaceae bacterium]
RFVVEAALRRKESRGAHFRADFPRAVDEMQKSRAMTLAGLNLRNTMHAQDILQEIHGITDQGGPKNV